MSLFSAARIVVLKHPACRQPFPKELIAPTAILLCRRGVANLLDQCGFRTYYELRTFIFHSTRTSLPFEGTFLLCSGAKTPQRPDPLCQLWTGGRTYPAERPPFMHCAVLFPLRALSLVHSSRVSITLGVKLRGKNSHALIGTRSEHPRLPLSATVDTSASVTRIRRHLWLPSKNRRPASRSIGRQLARLLQLLKLGTGTRQFPHATNGRTDGRTNELSDVGANQFRIRFLAFLHLRSIVA